MYEPSALGFMRPLAPSPPTHLLTLLTLLTCSLRYQPNAVGYHVAAVLTANACVAALTPAVQVIAFSE